MKLLVTGGAGFIGSNFIHYWLQKYPHDQIVNLDLLTYAGNLENLKNLSNPHNYEFVQGDIKDKKLVEYLTAKVDLIVHFAAESHVDNSIKNSYPFIETNVVGTHVLLEAARKFKTRFHHISTDEVFGSLNEGDEEFNENTPYNPRSPYSASKAASDHLVRAYWHTYKLPVTISNCSNNYGPRQHMEKFIPLLITNLLNNKKIPIYGSGKNMRDWLYVDDHCVAIDMIISKGRLGETYLIGGGSKNEKEVSNLDLAKKIIHLIGKTEDSIEYVKDRAGHDFRYAINHQKISKELNWHPSINLDEGLLKTIAWYQHLYE